MLRGFSYTRAVAVHPASIIVPRVVFQLILLYFMLLGCVKHVAVALVTIYWLDFTSINYCVIVYETFDCLIECSAMQKMSVVCFLVH